MITNEVLLEHLNRLFDKICPILHIEQADRAKFIARSLADCQKTQTSSVAINPSYRTMPKVGQLCLVALENLAGERDFPFISDSISDAFFNAVGIFVDYYLEPAPPNKATIFKMVEYNALLNLWCDNFNNLLVIKIKPAEFKKMITSTYNLATSALGNIYEQKVLLALCFYVALFHHFSIDLTIITPVIFENITKIKTETLQDNLINLLAKNDAFSIELKKLLKTSPLSESTSSHTVLEKQAATSLLDIFTQPQNDTEQKKNTTKIPLNSYQPSSSTQLLTAATVPQWQQKSSSEAAVLGGAQSAFKGVSKSNEESYLKDSMPKSKKAKTGF